MSHIDEYQLQIEIESNKKRWCGYLEEMLKVEKVEYVGREYPLTEYHRYPRRQKRADFLFKSDDSYIVVETKNPKATIHNIGQILEYMALMDERIKRAHGEEIALSHKTIGILVADDITDELGWTVGLIDNLYSLSLSTGKFCCKRVRENAIKKADEEEKADEDAITGIWRRAWQRKDTIG